MKSQKGWHLTKKKRHKKDEKILQGFTRPVTC